MEREQNSFGHHENVPSAWSAPARLWYWLRAGYRHLRIGRGATRILGPQYRRSRDLIEIDITYLCNLKCLNCNRSVRQAPEALHLSIDTVRDFVDTSISRGKRWRRIRILGGEPTLHPHFAEVMQELQRYRAFHNTGIVEVVTNGHGELVQQRLLQLPRDVWVENSSKEGEVQPAFGPFNLAPIDDPSYAHADYSNGCAIMRDCGMGLTPLGYYPCAVAGGIDRITGDALARSSLPDDADEMSAAIERLCRLCGRFRDGHYVPKNLRPPLLEEKLSPSWRALYQRWSGGRKTRRPLPVLSTDDGEQNEL